jgi:SPASM domain peptide maturase of grasp-with-spasm system
MNTNWFEPFKINNAIIDIENEIKIESILKQLNNLKCKSIEFRHFNTSSFHLVNKVFSTLESTKSIISSLGFVIPFSKDADYENLKREILKNPRISYFIIYNSPEKKFYEPLRKKTGYVIYTDENIYLNISCGIVSSENFTINTRLFTESQHHNTCLNRKISIDKDGNIKNCPSMAQSFGNIKDTTLEEALNHPDFKKYWNINKDQIEVCKDCEFRHICTDCRAYIEEPNNMYSKPLKCGYNPYTNVWEEWSTNPLKQKAIEFYGMQELVKKDA